APVCANLGRPAKCGIATSTSEVHVSYGEKYRDLYVGDTVLLGNLTLQGGVRADRQQSRNVAVSVGANPLLASALNLPCVTALRCTGGTLNASLPAISFGGDPGTLKWNSISTRIGAKYALGTNMQTLLITIYNGY